MSVSLEPGVHPIILAHHPLDETSAGKIRDKLPDVISGPSTLIAFSNEVVVTHNFIGYGSFDAVTPSTEVRMEQALQNAWQLHKNFRMETGFKKTVVHILTSCPLSLVFQEKFRKMSEKLNRAGEIQFHYQVFDITLVESYEDLRSRRIFPLEDVSVKGA